MKKQLIVIMTILPVLIVGCTEPQSNESTSEEIINEVQSVEHDVADIPATEEIIEAQAVEPAPLTSQATVAESSHSSLSDEELLNRCENKIKGMIDRPESYKLYANSAVFNYDTSHGNYKVTFNFDSYSNLFEEVNKYKGICEFDDEGDVVTTFYSLI